MLKSCYVVGLTSLVSLSLQNNQLQALGEMNDMQKLVNVDLSGNSMIKFDELSKLQSLKVLDLANNGIDMHIKEFKETVLEHIKSLSKLQYLSFFGNPVCKRISHFTYFIIFELPDLKYYDWDLIKRESKEIAQKYESDGVWEQDEKKTFLK